MSSSVRAGLEALLAVDSSLEGVVMMLCDQPFVTAGLIDQLVERRRQTDKLIVATDYGGTYGVPALFTRELFGELTELGGDQGARQIIRNHPDDNTAVSFIEASIDIDTPQDYNTLRMAVEI